MKQKIKRFIHYVRHSVLTRPTFPRISIFLLFLFLLSQPSITVFADTNAKEASNYVLQDWVAPIFGVIVVYRVIKEFMDSKWIQGIALLFFGGIIYAFIKNPTGILETLSNLKSYFGL